MAGFITGSGLQIGGLERGPLLVRLFSVTQKLRAADQLVEIRQHSQRPMEPDGGFQLHTLNGSLPIQSRFECLAAYLVLPVFPPSSKKNEMQVQQSL